MMKSCFQSDTPRLFHENYARDIAADALCPFQYPIRRLMRSREFSKQRDWQFELSHRFEIWQAHRQHYRCACQISERSVDSKHKSRGFETSWDLTIRRLIGYWNGSSGIYFLRWTPPFPRTGRIPVALAEELYVLFSQIKTTCRWLKTE